jgi:hypothetical protein
MKFAILILLSVSVTLTGLTGCSAVPLPQKTSAYAPINIVNAAFDAMLPRDFNGPVDFYHTNPYLRQTFEIRGSGVQFKEGVGWTWTWLEWRRKGISEGWIKLGEIPR